MMAWPRWVLSAVPDADALRETADALASAERSGDEMALHLTRFARGITLAHRDGPEREAGFDLLAQVREAAVRGRFSLVVLPVVDIHLAQQQARSGDLDGAIELARAVVDDLFDSGGAFWGVLATTVLVEALLGRGADADLQDARVEVERLAAVPTDPGLVLHEIWLLWVGTCTTDPDLHDLPFLLRIPGSRLGHVPRERIGGLLGEHLPDGITRQPRRTRNHRPASQTSLVHNATRAVAGLHNDGDRRRSGGNPQACQGVSRRTEVRHWVDLALADQCRRFHARTMKLGLV
jgi:hypothetical protein